MPQTIEAINHAKAADVPIIVAINKIDKANANPEMIKKQLADRDVLIESWGGKYQSVEISAKSGIGIDKLLESIIVESEILELKANPDRLARGVVIESKLDKGKGIIATVLVQKGSLKVGDPFIAGQFSGRVRGLFNDRGQKTKEAGPSKPVMVLGFSGLPQAGDTFTVLESEKDTKEISFRRQQIKREQDFRKIKHLTLDQISKRIKEGQVKELSIILKGDVDGSVEAIGDSLSKLSNEEVAVKIIHKGVGAVSESDVLLASASDAVVIGFQVRPTIKAREIAQRENVDIRLYKVIYNAISDVKDALEGLLEPEFEEKNLSVIEVREIFKVPKIGLVAGCYVVSGKVTRNDKAKLFRNDRLIYDGKIDSLKRFKEDAKEVVGGFECGVALDGFDDIKVNDVIETYRLDEIKRSLVLAK
jgi:translation initiation factor IF-2